MEKLTPALTFEDLLFENNTQIPKSGKLIKLFEAQDVDGNMQNQETDDTDDTDVQEFTQAPTQETQTGMDDENAYSDESLLDVNQPQNAAKSMTGDAGANAGGGIMPICTTTGNILLGRRSDRVSEPGTWSVWGGRLDIATTNELNDNNVKNKVQEVFEDMTKYNKFEDLIASYVYETKENDFEWHNYLGLVEDEFEPMHDWRIIEYRWMSMDEIRTLGRDAIHFGLQLLFDNDSDTIRPLLIPKPKTDDAPTQDVPQETPTQDVPQETPTQETSQTQNEFGEIDDVPQPQVQENEEGI